MKSLIVSLTLLALAGCGSNFEKQSTGGGTFTAGCHATIQKYGGCCLSHGGPDKSCTTEGQLKFDVNAFLICQDGMIAPDCLYTP